METENASADELRSLRARMDQFEKTEIAIASIHQRSVSQPPIPSQDLHKNIYSVMGAEESKEIMEGIETGKFAREHRQSVRQGRNQALAAIQEKGHDAYMREKEKERQAAVAAASANMSEEEKLAKAIQIALASNRKVETPDDIRAFLP